VVFCLLGPAVRGQEDIARYCAAEISLGMKGSDCKYFVRSLGNGFVRRSCELF